MKPARFRDLTEPPDSQREWQQRRVYARAVAAMRAGTAVPNEDGDIVIYDPALGGEWHCRLSRGTVAFYPDHRRALLDGLTRAAQ